MGRSSNFTHDRYQRAAKMLGHALVLGDLEGWSAARKVWTARLTATERAVLACTSLTAINSDYREMVVQAVQGGAGMPQAAFLSVMDQAAFWADMADANELEAYCLASFKAMPRGRQAAFLDYVQGKEAA